jgi:prepilin-type N-terminal cleavage/methylation domain-containing protein
MQDCYRHETLTNGHRATGFTIAELLVGMTIIAIVSAVALPHAAAWISRIKLRNAVVDLIFTIQEARMVAARENRSVILTFDPDEDGSPENKYLVFVDNGRTQASRWTRQPDERIVRVGNLPAGVELTEASFAGGASKTRFDTMGFPNGFGGHVYLKNNGGGYMGVHVNINGSPRIVKSVTGEKGSWK